MQKEALRLIVAADWMYESNLIPDKDLDRKVGDVLEKSQHQSLSAADLAVLEKAVTDEPVRV
jgi:hypothetical protein